MNKDSYPMTHIVAPGEHDVLCGRGGHTIHWTGNIKFRALVEQHRDRYHAASRVEKGKLVAEVVQIWRHMTPPGRFLTLTDPKLGDASAWHDIGDKSAQKKTAKRLREGHSSNSTTMSDEDSIISSTISGKRHLRRVSNDSMEKAAKRARQGFSIMPLSLVDETAEASGDEFEPWAPIKQNEWGASLDLDCLFEDSQPEAQQAPDLTAASWTCMTNTNNNNYVGSSLLQQIAFSIPSAACLTESILFD